MRVQRGGDKYAHIQTKSRNHSFINAYDFCSLLKLMTLHKIKASQNLHKRISTHLLTVLTNSVIVLLEQEKSTAFPVCEYWKCFS